MTPKRVPRPRPCGRAVADEDSDLGAASIDAAEFGVADEPAVELEQEGARAVAREPAVVRDDVRARELGRVGEHRAVVRVVVEGREARRDGGHLGARRLARAQPARPSSASSIAKRALTSSKVSSDVTGWFEPRLSARRAKRDAV